MIKNLQLSSSLYKQLIELAVGNTYCSTRLRILISLLTLTGLKLNEIRFLKVYQIESLRNNGFVSFESLNQQKHTTTIYLTEEGKQLLKDTEKDFNYLFFIRNFDSYIFTSESNYDQPISREIITKELNKILKIASKNFANNY